MRKERRRFGAVFKTKVVLESITEKETIHQLTSKFDGKGRSVDNIIIECFWRTLKYKHIYLDPTNGGIHLYEEVRKYIELYNSDRRHRRINNNTPENISCLIQTIPKNKPKFEISLS